MDEVFSDADIDSMSPSMRLLIQSVHAALPSPRNYTARHLYCAAAADNVDRISSLPDSILRNIVSRLNAKEAARTALLSSRWRLIWYTVPVRFVDADLLTPSRTVDSADIAAAVTNALRSHPGPFLCVYLTATPMADHLKLAEQWLHLLSMKGVSELYFVNNQRTMCVNLPLPITIFECRYLTVLYLGFWSYPLTFTVQPSHGVAFPCLLELGLCSVFIEDRDFVHLLARCPELLKLIIVSNLSPMCIRVKHLKLKCIELCTAATPEIHLQFTPRLSRLLLWHPFGTKAMTTRIRIGCAPNLSIVGFLEPLVHQLEIGSTIIKFDTEARSLMSTVPSVQMLAIQIKLSEARMLPSFLNCFPNLKTLYVQSEIDDDQHPSSTRNSKLSPKFWEEEVAPLQCIQERLTKMVFRDFQGKKSEVNFIKFILKHAQVLETIEVFLTPGTLSHHDAATILMKAMASLQRASKRCKMVLLRSPFTDEGIPWCHERARNMHIQDPFDTTKCLYGNCLEGY